MTAREDGGPVPPLLLVRPVGLSGLGTTGSRVVMMLVWLSFTTVVLQGSSVDVADAIALALLVPALWLATSPVPEPISVRLGLVVVALAGASAVVGIDPYQDTLFPFLALTGYLFAFVIIRGRAVLALAAYGVSVLVVATTTSLRGEIPALQALTVETFPQVLWGPASLLLAVGWRAMLRRSERRLGQLELAQSDLAVAEAETRERIRAWGESLADLSGDVGALLDRAAAGTTDDDDARAAAALEVGLRDRLRAPRLVVEPLLAATVAARARGAVVVLLDDGDPHRPLTANQRAELLGRLEAAPAGARLTIRLNPSDRAEAGTVVLAVGERLTRAVLAAETPS